MPIMVTTDQIVAFLREETRYLGVITEATSLQSDVGVFGDDMDELLAAYAKRFDVDMSKYLWYFHTGEEGWSVGSWFFTPLYDRVEKIPITVRMLCGFANGGHWAVEYPQHTVPDKRPDIVINQLLVGLLVVVAVVLLAIRFLG